MELPANQKQVFWPVYKKLSTVWEISCCCVISLIDTLCFSVELCDMRLCLLQCNAPTEFDLTISIDNIVMIRNALHGPNIEMYN